MVSVFADGYENFGWQLDSTADLVGNVDSITMKFKRDRKIRNKAELTRLQRNFDACVSEILSLEFSKYIKASIAAYILAIPAFVGWTLPYFLYQGIRKKKTLQVTPLIDQKYDELYAVCEKVNSLLHKTEKQVNPWEELPQAVGKAAKA